MIVERLTYRYKPGKRQEGLALLKAESKRANAKGYFSKAIRNFLHRSDLDISVTEFEFENTADMDASWARWVEDPDSQAFIKALDLLRESGITSEILDFA